MRKLLIILFLGMPFILKAQSESEVISAMQSLHQAMVKNDSVTMLKMTDKALSYGHSNGWIETQSEMIRDIGSFLQYHKIIEDSISVKMSNNLASVRFVGDYTVTNKGNDGQYHLRVLEIWIKNGDQWQLFARQAVK